MNKYIIYSQISAPEIHYRSGSNECFSFRVCRVDKKMTVCHVCYMPVWYTASGNTSNMPTHIGFIKVTNKWEKKTFYSSCNYIKKVLIYYPKNRMQKVFVIESAVFLVVEDWIRAIKHGPCFSTKRFTHAVRLYKSARGTWALPNEKPWEEMCWRQEQEGVYIVYHHDHCSSHERPVGYNPHVWRSTAENQAEGRCWGKVLREAVEEWQLCRPNVTIPWGQVLPATRWMH